jgi:hypothetical protein
MILMTGIKTGKEREPGKRDKSVLQSFVNYKYEFAVVR